jgi:hypothetical protein
MVPDLEFDSSFPKTFHGFSVTVLEYCHTLSRSHLKYLRKECGLHAAISITASRLRGELAENPFSPVSGFR